MTRTKTEEVLALIHRYGVLRPRDLSAHGIPREYLVRLHRQGILAAAIEFGSDASLTNDNSPANFTDITLEELP